MKTAINRKKQFGSLLSVGLNCFLILLKMLVGIFSGSVAVFASAFDSLLDLVAAIFTYVGIRIGDVPPDEDHPFGHGKFEDFAGLIQAVLIIVGAFFIIGTALDRLFHPNLHGIEPMAGIIVMLVALLLDYVVSSILLRIATETESSALFADAQHLRTDFMGSTAVLIGLILVKITGNHIFDPIVALIVAAMILGVGWQIVEKVFKYLMDTALPIEEERQIMDIIRQTMPEDEPMRVDSLRTRRSGSHRLIVFNLLVNPRLTVEEAHGYCDQVEAALMQVFPNSLVTIHLEPYSVESQSPVGASQKD
jgi:cation diffusion facilitator family transporter